MLHPVAGVGDGNGLDAVSGQLIPDHRSEGILDEALFYLAAGGHDRSGLADPGLELQQGSSADGILGGPELFLRDDEGDHPHARQLVSLADGCAALPGGDHEVLDGVDGDELFGVHPEEAVAGGFQLDLALLDLAAVHVLVCAQGAEPLSAVVFMKHPRRHLPDIQVLLTHGEQHRDVFLRHHMALAEAGVLVLVLDDLGQVVAEHMAHGLLGFDKLHVSASRISISSPARTVPSLTTTAKMPSVGITHLPTAFLMAQSL